MSDEKQTVSYDKILRDAAHKGAGIHSIKKTYPAYLILIILLVLSFFVRDIVSNQIEGELQSEFNKSTTNVISRIETVNLRNLEVLFSMSGLYDLIIDVVRDYFELYATIPTRTYTSISGISYIAQVPKRSLSEFVFYVRSQGYYDFEVQSNNESDLYYLINHSIPYSRNIHRIGFDLAPEKQMFNAIEYARDNNKATSTGFYNTRPDTLGIYLITPIYKYGTEREDLNDRRNNFAGVVAVELNAQKFFETALLNEFLVGTTYTPIDTTIAYKIYDKDENGELFTIYSSTNADLIDSDYKPMIKKDETILIGDREITIRFYTTPTFGGQLTANMPLASLIISILISFAFFGFVYAVVTSRSRALELADRMTRSQRRIVETSKDIIAVMKFDRNWISMNPAAKDIFGVDEIEVIGTSFDDYVYDDENLREFNKILNIKADHEVTERTYLKMKSQTEKFRWVNWSFTISPKDNLIYCIGRDVTIEKLAEEQTMLQQKQLKLAELFAREAIESKNFFMRKMSFQLRNSLTGILGFLQMVTGKIYETEEERDSYVKLAEESSEEIFTFVSDMIDATVIQDKGTVLFESSKLADIYNAAQSHYTMDKDVNHNVKFIIDDDTKKVKVFGNIETITIAMYSAFDILSTGIEKTEIIIQAQENNYERIVEVQILGSANKLVSEMIGMYKLNSENTIEALKNDKDDILLKISKINAYFNIMGAKLTVDSLGVEDGNLITFRIPFNKV